MADCELCGFHLNKIKIKLWTLSAGQVTLLGMWEMRLFSLCVSNV